MMLGCRALSSWRALMGASSSVHHPQQVIALTAASMRGWTAPRDNELAVTCEHRTRSAFGRPPGARGLTAAAGAVGGGDASPALPPFKLVVYSKQDCPLCDKLKETLVAIIDRSAFAPSLLTGVQLEVRDILSDPAWEAAYSMSVPVLKVAGLDGSNEVRIMELLTCTIRI